MRQPGSAFKPFIYLAAIEDGFTPNTTIEDSPVDIEGWRPENFGKDYRGQISLRTALTHSSNMAAVRLMQAVGTDRVVEVANRLGVLSARNVGPTLALGTSETTLLEMTSAFAVFANGGLAVVPEVVERIVDDRGRVLFERSKRPAPRVVSARAVSAMNDMMNAVVAGGTARSASFGPLSSCRKDRHEPELQGCLVHRLHGAMGGRRLDGQRQCKPHASASPAALPGRDLESAHAESP